MERRTIIKRLAVVVAVGLFGAQIFAVPTARATDDALHRKVLAELRRFTDWLSANNAKGFIGEVGWPGRQSSDAAQWNDVGNAWYTAADGANLWVSQWASGEWFHDTYPLSLYEDLQPPEGLDTPNTQASVVEAHPSTTGYLRGTQDAGGGFCGPQTQATSKFSNRSPGVYDQCYHYDNQDSLNFIASRGNKIVRLDFRWEVLQRKPAAALSAPDLQRFEDFVHRATSAGLIAIIEPHNFGQYYLYSAKKHLGVRRPIGSKQMPIADFADLWSRLSAAFKGDANVYYDLMNEPVKLPATDGRNGAGIWEQASQAALDAIRANGDTKTVMVPGYFYSSVRDWTTTHPTSWISDPANNFRYEGHHYFDQDGSGRYAQSYAQEVANAQQAGF